MRKIYLDNAATTKICPEALKKYTEASEEHYGNPSSLHTLGVDAEGDTTRARRIILDSVGGKNCQLIFTSSGSEANNLAIIGRALSKDRYKKGMKIISTDSEHASVREPLLYLKSLGHNVVFIPTVGGVLNFDALSKELTPDVILVTVMMVNNETGAVYDLPRVAKLMKDRCPDAFFHVDATQGYMKLPFTMSAIGADMLTVSAHKIEGPKGVGALIVGDNVLKDRGLSPIVYGGGQEMALRSGTENVPAIAAFGAAAEVMHKTCKDNIQHMAMLRSLFIERLSEDALAEIKPTLPPRYAPHIINITLPGIKSETMLHYLSSRGILVSSGSACSSNTAHRPSHALVAYGISEDDADSSIRISLSHESTKEEADELIQALADGITRLARKK